MNRNNALYLVVGIVICAVVFLGYEVYQDQTQPEGMQINAGPDGLTIKTK